MRDYVRRRHKKDWNVVQQRMDELLSRASKFIEPLTRLPLVATLLAELLPTMTLEQVPKSRWELFNVLLLRGLLRRDIHDPKAEVVTSDFRQLPPERQEALLLLCELAVDGLLAEQPKLILKYADILAKCKQSQAIEDELLEVAKSVMVSFCEMDETQEEVTYYHFLHLSFQEFLAAMALKYPTRDRPAGNTPSRLVSCAKTLLLGERFDNFWLFAAGFFRTDPEVFFRELFSNITINMTEVNDQQQVIMQDMLFKMLQEMIPEVNDSTMVKYSSALEQVTEFLNRRVSNVRWYSSTHIGHMDTLDSAALCHALCLLPGLTTVELFDDFNLGNVFAALHNQHRLETLFLYPDFRNSDSLLDEEMDSLKPLLHKTSLTSLQLWWIIFSADQLQTLAGELSKMNHSLKYLYLRGDEKEGGECSVAMDTLCSAISKHHTSLSSLNLWSIPTDSDSPMQPLASLLVNSNSLQRLAVGCSMSRHTFEVFCAAVQSNTSLTCLGVGFDVRVTPWSPGNQGEHRACIQQLSRVAIHHASITRLEIGDRGLDDEDAMSTVEEVGTTKGEPHQLTQLYIMLSDLTVEGVDRLREVIEREQLNLTIAVCHNNHCYHYGGPIVEHLPFWTPHEK